MLPVMCWLFFNSAANWHYHLSPTGEIVKHSHPYTQSEGQDAGAMPFQEHSHKQSDFACLEQVTKTGALEASECALLMFFEPENDGCVPGYYLPPVTILLLPANVFRGPPSIS